MPFVGEQVIVDRGVREAPLQKPGQLLAVDPVVAGVGRDRDVRAAGVDQGC